MKRLELVGIYLLFIAVAVGHSGVCSGLGDNPCQKFPLSLLDWNEDTNEIDIDRFIPDDSTNLNEGGSLSLIERLLLFPVCYFDESQCNKNAQGDGRKLTVFRICEDTEESCLLEYTIETGWHALNGIIESIQQANSVTSPQYKYNIYNILSDAVSTVQSVFHFIMTNVTTTLSCLGENYLPDSGIWSIMAAIQELFGKITWAMIRYVVVSLIAISLFPSRKQFGKIARKAISTTKHVYDSSKEKSIPVKTFQPPLSSNFEDDVENLSLNKHYPMCEYFDHQKCNCGGSSYSKEPLVEDEHYKMCEFFDQLPCNCGGVKKNSVCTVSGSSVNVSSEDQILDSILLTSKDEVFKDTVADTNRIINEMKSFNEPDHVEMLPQWVQMATGGVRVPDTKLLTCMDKARDDTKTERLEQFPNSSICNTPENEMDLNTESLSKDSDVTNVTNVCFENSSPKKVQFDMDTIFQNSEEEHAENNCLPEIVDDNFDTDSEEGSLMGNLNESSTSDIGSPFLNSSFKEDSPYVTANTVTYEDLMDRGDGAIFSTLTRRSPYAEEGLTDLSTDMSVRESDGSIIDSSILDVSDLNSSISFSAGEGVIEVAALIALQTIWRVVKRVWQNKMAERRINNVAVEEKESGLYIIRQKNKSKGFRSPVRTAFNHNSELLTDLDQNNNRITEFLLYNEDINISNKGELFEQSISVEKNNTRTTDTFRKWIDYGRQSQNFFKTNASESKINSETSPNHGIQFVVPNLNNNARYSKRKRASSKQYSDSGNKADCEECDQSDRNDHKRGRTVYKTRETLDKCYAKNLDRHCNHGNRPEINTPTRGRHVDIKRQSYKHGSGPSTSSKSTRKKIRTRKNFSTQKRKISNEVKDKIDKLSQELSNASMNDHIGGYLGDTSDDFADDSSSSSSSDEKSEIQCDVLEKKVL